MADEKRETRVVPGGQTFGDETARARGGKRAARAYWLKDQAEDRLALLMVEGARGDRLARPFPSLGCDRKILRSMAGFARLPDRTKLLILRGKRGDLERELTDLIGSGAPAKRLLLEPVIRRQISELDDDIGYLAVETGELAPKGKNR
jgi:hypothetical protein